MVKLTTLKSSMPTLGSGLAFMPKDERERDRLRDRQGWRRWYKTARWRALRWATLTRDMFTCQWPGCGRTEGDTSQLVADHRIPHRGDEALFWDDANLWTLCKPCHDGAKQRAEQGRRP